MGLPSSETSRASVQQSANLEHQLKLVKDLLSAPVTSLVEDSSQIREVLVQIKAQLPEPLQAKLWPAGHLPYFQIEVKAAQQRIEARKSQASLKNLIVEKCKAANQRKATLDAKADISNNVNRLESLKKELADLEEKVQATQKLIQAEEASIADSKRETQEMTKQLQAELAEINNLSRQILTDDGKDDEAIIARVDSVRTEAIQAIEEFLM